MRRVSVDDLEIGARLAKSIYTADQRMLLCQGTLLTSKFIKRLKELCYGSVYIDDGLIDDVIVDELITERTRMQALRCVREVADSIKHNGEFNVAGLKQTVSNLIDELISNRDLMLNLNDIQSFDDYTFDHSVNVTVVSLLIGMHLYYPIEKLRDLGLGVLLHDLGKTKVPYQILNKPGKLTDEEFAIVKQHTWQGFELLRRNPEIKITCAHVALQHHERVDGSGYPRNLNQAEILEFARISSVADVYDALSNDRCYRKRMPADQVCQILKAGAGSQFDPMIVEKFIDRIALYPKGTKVLLNDGSIGFVIKQNSMVPARPMVRIFWHKQLEIDKPIEIDLLQESNLSIMEVLESR